MMSDKLTYSIDQIFLGWADGEDEAIRNPKFHEYFFNYKNLVDKATQPLVYLILGKKGTGKTLMGEYIREKLDKEENSVAKIIPFSEFRMHALRELKSADVPPNEYMPIWNYIVLIELLKLVIRNDELKENQWFGKVKSFIDRNYQRLILTNFSDKDISNLKNIGTNTDFIRPLIESQEEQYIDDFVSFIPKLEEALFSLLESSGQYRYTLILDKLDDRFEREALYINSIISLVKVVDDLNKKMLRNRFNAKVMILLRTDIFSLLNDTDLNKRERDSSVKINWGDIADYSSPLFDLIIKKIKTSIPELENDSRDRVLRRFFPAKVYNISIDKFLLSRTLFRPRDIITYLKLIQERFPKSKSFTTRGFMEVERDYSEYFLKELENEMNGHVGPEVISELISLLIRFNRFNFNFEEINRYNETNRVLTKLSIEEGLKTLFDFSLVGNKWNHYKTDRLRHAWKYRHDRVEVDYRKEFVLHFGLWKYFNV